MLGIANIKIETIANGTIAEGDVLIEDGKIKALGKDLDLSSCRKIIDGKRRVATPGLIDAHTHLGLSESGVGREGRDTNEGTDPITPFCTARDGINMGDEAFEVFRKSGITVVGILPGSGNILGGTGLALKCRGMIVDEAVLKDPVGMKAALGENPKNAYGGRRQSPSTRMGSAALLRGALLRAKEYFEKLNATTDGSADFKKDWKSEALLPVIQKQIPLIIHCHRHDDIITAVRICKEFDVKYVLDHVTDGYLLKDIIKDESVHCAVGPTLHYGSKVENKERDFRTPVVFAREDIPFCFITDHPIVDGRNLILTASTATQWGMSDEDALKAITLGSAEHLGIDDKVGSLEPGKDADIVIWSANPLEFTSFVDVTIIDGEIVYERSQN
ncbi:MAG: amidohydrolase [Firmicutes bacterium]|nr:amidohydrolase [Bacillota bacterium]